MKNKKIRLLFSLSFLIMVVTWWSFAAVGCQSSYNETGITREELETHLKFLAHDDRGGRFPGTPGYMAAAEYVRARLKESGLEAVCKDEKGKNSYFQSVPMRHFIYGKDNSIKVKSSKGEKVFTNLKDFYFESPGEGGTRRISGTPVYIGCGIHESGIWNDFAGLDIKGKPVFLGQYFPAKRNGKHVLPKILLQKYGFGFPSMQKYPAILERGASCIIHVPRKGQAANWDFFSSQAHVSSLRPVHPYGAEWLFVHPVPVIVASKAMIDYFFEDKPFDPVEWKTPYETFEFNGFEITIEIDVTEELIYSPNVVGLVRGTDPELKNTYIAVGAHLDHLGIFEGQVFNGACDDASGCAALMEAARELVKNPTKRSVLFLFFTGEESSLSGSRYFVEHCPVPLEQIKTFINVDEVGGKKDNNKQMDINIASRSRGSHSFEKAMLAAGKILDKATLKIDKTEPKPYQVHWVDDYSFIKKGIPIIVIGAFPNYGDHTPGDDVEKINFEHLHEVTRFIHALVLELGNQ
jgi:hypothetical protein